MSGKVNKSNKKIILTVLLILIFISIYMYSCEYNDLGLFTTLDGEEETGNGKNVANELDIGSKEFFLELKEKQKNKNPLNDINVRKAIFYAIDRKRIVNELLGEYGEVLNSLFTKDSYYYNSSWSEYNYDLNKAKEFLSKAGYVDNPLYIIIGSDDRISRKTIDKMIKEDLDKIGIKIWILNEPSKEWYQDCVMKGNYELGVWAIKNFDGSSLNFNFSSDKIPIYKTDENKICENFYWYNNPDIDEILMRAAKESDTGKKKELFKEFQDTLASDAVVLPLYSRLVSIAYNNKKIKNIDISIKNNKVFFNIENWILPNKEQTGEEKINEIVVGYEGENYILSNPFDLNYINNLVWEGLWEINEEGEYEPILVEEHYDSLEHSVTSISSLEVKVILKDKIFWEDGSSITSEDVKYTYDTILENDSIVNINEDYSKVEGIEIINEKEFNIVFKENFKDWKKLFGIIFQKGSLEEKDINNFSTEDIVASGPYKIEEYVDREYLLLKKNEFYFGEAPEIDYIKILFDTDINNLISMLKDGEIDLLSIPTDLDLMRDLKENEDLNLWVEPGNMLEHLAICLKQKEE
ncbi:MAG: hypothetical protein COT09_02105 [Candidatus Hydromicrobium americanum]|nr:MAG: hypothetical protein COT09_02105 [Candidatus Hydromicrobium americanum]